MFLVASYAFVLQDPDHNAAVFCLTFCRSVGRNLPAGTHRAGSQDVGQRNPALLLQKLGDVGRPLLAQPLVQRCGTHGGCVALYLNHVAGDGERLLA